MSKLSPLDQLQAVPSADDVDWSDRQNLADTATAPERRLGVPAEQGRGGPSSALSATPFPATLSDPGRLGQSSWFQQSMILTAPPRKGTGLAAFLLMAGVTFVGAGGFVWLFLA